MDPYLANNRQFLQGLPPSSRGYAVPNSRDESHALPTPTPPATPTLPVSYAYVRHSQPVAGAVPATSVPPSRPMTPVTPSHKPPDHGISTSPYSVASFLHPSATKIPDSSYLTAQLENSYRQATLEAGHAPQVPCSTRSSDSLSSSRLSSQSHYSNQIGLGGEQRLGPHSYPKLPASVTIEGRSHLPAHTTQAPSAEFRNSQVYSSTQPHPNALRAYPYPYGSHNSSNSRVIPPAAATAAAHVDSKNFLRPEPRPPDPRQEQWNTQTMPDAKSFERIPPSVHISDASASVNGSKDALYLGKKPDDIANARHPDNSIIRKFEPIQVNGSRDPLYPNGSHTIHTPETKRDLSAERKVDSRPKEDSALDLSVKTVRQPPDSGSAEPEKNISHSPHIVGGPVEKSMKTDVHRRTPSTSVSITPPYRMPSRDPSPSQVSDLTKHSPGVLGVARGVPSSHTLQFGVTGSPRPLQSPSPLHMPVKRTGDSPYLDHLAKHPKLSHTPPGNAPALRYPAEASLSDYSRRMYPTLQRDVMPDPNAGLNPLHKGPEIRYSGESVIERRPLYQDTRNLSAEWKGSRDVSLEKRDSFVSIERKPNPELSRDSSLERRDLAFQGRDLTIYRKDSASELKYPKLDKRESMAFDAKYAYEKYTAAHAPSVDPSRAWKLPSDNSKHNILLADRQKYVPGSQPVPTSVPVSLPQPNSRVPSAQQNLYSSQRHPPDTRLPQTPYPQPSHTMASGHPPSQFNPAQSTPAKTHLSYAQHPSSSSSSSGSSNSSSKTNQVPSSQNSGYSSPSHRTAGQLYTATHPHHYASPYTQAYAAHYAQQQAQQHPRQPRPSPSVHPPYSMHPNSKPSVSLSSPVSLPPRAVTPQQAHQAYMYPQHRSDTSPSLHPSKRSNQLSPHPSGSPHPSLSPHPSASPNPAASPHPSASPHHLIPSPHAGVSPHHQSRLPSQYSPHHSQRSPSVSTTQHSYSGGLPPSPYSGSSSHPTPPSSRPPSAASQHSHSSQSHSGSGQSQRSPYPSPASLQPSPSPSHLPQSSASHPSQPYSVPPQSRSPYATQGNPLTQSRIGSKPSISHPSQIQLTGISSSQIQYSSAAQPPVTYHTQAQIYSQPHTTWTTQPFTSHVTKLSESQAPMTHPYSQSYPHLAYSTKPSSQPTPPASHPSHPPKSKTSPQPHPLYTPVSYSSQSHLPPSSKPQNLHQPQAPHSQLPQDGFSRLSEGHLPPTAETARTYHQSREPPSDDSLPHSTQALSSHIHYASEPQPTSQTRPPNSQPSQVHPPHSQSSLAQPSTGHPPHSEPSQVHPPYSQPSPVQPSPSLPPHSEPSQTCPPLSKSSSADPPRSQSSEDRPPRSQSSQDHPHSQSSETVPTDSQSSHSESSQAHPQRTPSSEIQPPYSQASQASPPLSHPTEAQPHTAEAQAHPQPSQTLPPHSQPSQTHPPHSQPSQAVPPHSQPSQALPPHSQPSQSHPPHSQPSQTHPSHSQPSPTLPPHSQPSQSRPPHSQPSQTHPPHSHPPHSQPSQTHPSHSQPSPTLPPHTQPSQSHPSHSQPSQTHPPHSQPSQTHPPHSQSHPPHSQPSQTHPPHYQLSQTHPPHTQLSQAHPPHSQPSQAHPPHSQPSQTHPPHSQTHPPRSQPSQVHPPHSQPSQAHPHPPRSQSSHSHLPYSQSSQAYPQHTQPSQAHPPHSQPSQTHPPHAQPSHPQSHPSHLSQSRPIHPSHPSQGYPARLPHPSHVHSLHASQSHPQAYPPQHHPAQAYPPHPSQAYQPHPSQAHTPHPSRSHPQVHPYHSSQPYAPHPSQPYPPQMYPLQPRSPTHPPPPLPQPSQNAAPQSGQPQAHPSQPPQLHQPSQIPQTYHPPHPYPSQSRTSHGSESHSYPHQPPSQPHHLHGQYPRPHSPRAPPPQPHSPRTQPNQAHSPRGHASQPHPHAYPAPQEYRPPSHPSQENSYPIPGHPAPQSHPQARLPYPPSVRHPYPSSTQPSHQNHTSYPLHPSHTPHSAPSHPTDASQPPRHPAGYPHHGQHPYYPPQPYPHPSIKTENVAPTTSQYPGYPYSSHPNTRQDVAPPAGGHSQPTVHLPPGTSCSPRYPQDSDPSRIRTKGEQKSFDPRNAEGGKLECKPDPEALHSESQEKTNSLQTFDNSNNQKAEKPAVESHKASNVDNDRKLPVSKEEEKQSNQTLPTSVPLEPVKAALAVKIHKKLQHAESMESIVAKKENISENVLPKEELPVEDEWDKGFSKLIEDLGANPDGVTSKKCRDLGRKYLHKVQIQNAIDNDLIVPPPVLFEEEEEESEPEAPVKFRGKFKSIKDKKVERLILTYASHSDESAVDMIPDDDASDFEEELEREIRLKSKKQRHAKKKVVSDSSSDSESGKVGKKRGNRASKENKLDGKQDSDYSVSSSSGSSSDTSDSDGSDSDSEESESESSRPTRKGRRYNNEKLSKHKNKWVTDSSESEEEEIPKGRRRRGRKYSSDDEPFKPSHRTAKRRKKQDDSSDSDDSPKKSKARRRKRKSESDEDEEVVVRRKIKKKDFAKKSKRVDDSDEDSESELPRKTRGMKKKIQESKKGKRRQKISSSESEEDLDDRKGRKKNNRMKKNAKKELQKAVEDSSEDSDIPTKKKTSSKPNVIIDSDESEGNSKNDELKEKGSSLEESKVIDEEQEVAKTEAGDETDLHEEEEFEDFPPEDENKEPDSVIDKLDKIKAEEDNREDVQEMKAWLGEMNRDLEKQLNKLKDLTFRNNWKKPVFGGGEDFFHGWQSEVKKYKSNARFPKKLCLATKHQGVVTPSKSSPRKPREKESPKRASSSPAKNTRSQAGIIKTALAVAEDERLKVAARPVISSVMQRFFDKVLADSGSESSKEETSCKRFSLGPFSSFGTQRVPTGLTPTPSVAPSMMASDNSDLDSLESLSLKMDRPKSDSFTVYKRCIVNRLLEKIKPKYNDKKLASCPNKTRNILEVTNKPQLLPTPGMPTSEKELEEMTPSQIKMSTRFFRKETVENYRSNFEVIVSKNGINEFTPILYESRTRNKNKQIQDAATVKSVFGFDIPPHVLKRAEAKKAKKATKKVDKDKKDDSGKKDDNLSIPASRSSTPSGSAVAALDDDEDSKLRSERSESVPGEPSITLVPKKVKRKFRRRRDGFEYAPKKKKVKPDDKAKPSRKRLPVRKHVNWPEQSRDVASEVRTWVTNKGLGETVLHKAARLQYHDVVVYCAESPDFDINVRDNAGYTPLHEACNRGHLDIAQVLCAHGAHVNAPGCKGMRPLHEAVENGHGELARLLLAYGADPTLTTYGGQTCLALSADIQTTQLLEGFMADLKGQWTSEKWHFSGPARIFDPEEQGCDIFGDIPGHNLLQNVESGESSERSDQPENPAILDISSVDGSSNCQNTLDRGKEDSLPKPVNTESLLTETNSSLKQKSNDLMVRDREAVCDNEESESKVKNEPVEVSDTKPLETSTTPSNSDASGENGDKESASQDVDTISDEEELKDLMFEISESDMLDLFELEGQPDKYHLLTDILAHLKMDYKEFVMLAKSVETLELSPADFKSRVHSCIVGSGKRDIASRCSRVVLVRITPAIKTILGIETLKL